MLDFIIPFVFLKILTEGLVIEEIIEEEEETVSSSNYKGSSSQYSVTQSQEINDSFKTERVSSNDGLSSNLDHMQALRNNPEAMRFVFFTGTLKNKNK